MYNRLLSSGSALMAAPGEGGSDPELPLDPPETPESAEAPETPVAETDAPAEPEAPAQNADWRDKELRRKHAQLKEEQRRRTELEAEVEALRKIAERGAAPAEETRPAPVVNDEARIEAEAEKRVAKRTFDAAANEADRAGRDRYKGDWEKVTDTLRTLGGFDMDTMQGILATDDPAKVLYELGNKPENYQRIMDLPPAKRLAELVKLGLPAPKTPNRPSNAPAPVEPLTGRARPDANELRDELSDEEWYARRARQREVRRSVRRAS